MANIDYDEYLRLVEENKTYEELRHDKLEELFNGGDYVKLCGYIRFIKTRDEIVRCLRKSDKQRMYDYKKMLKYVNYLRMAIEHMTYLTDFCGVKCGDLIYHTPISSIIDKFEDLFLHDCYERAKTMGDKLDVKKYQIKKIKNILKKRPYDYNLKSSVVDEREKIFERLKTLVNIITNSSLVKKYNFDKFHSKNSE